MTHKSLSHFNDRYTRLTVDGEVILNDCTLREGEQSAIVNFLPEQKVEIARRLLEAGLRQLQVGYPGLSDSDRQTFRTLRDAGIGGDLEAVVLSYLDSWAEQIQAAAECGASMINIVHVPSPPRREKIFKVSKAQIVERCEAAVQVAKAQGLFVTYCPADTTRTELEFSLELIRTAEHAGADRISVADTLGAATPGAVRFLIEQARMATRLPLAFHGHNDFGLAMANALAALEAGATVVDTTLNGWGDRTGNPPTEEFAAALQFLYGAAPELDVAALAALAKDAAARLDLRTPQTKPITGEAAFAHKLETHVKAVLSHPPAFEPFDPALVSGRRHVAIGQYSGPEAVRSRLRSLDIELDDEALGDVTRRVQHLARTTNRILSDDDLRALLERGI